MTMPEENTNGENLQRESLTMSASDPSAPRDEPGSASQFLAGPAPSQPPVQSQPPARPPFVSSPALDPPPIPSYLLEGDRRGSRSSLPAHGPVFSAPGRAPATSSQPWPYGPAVVDAAPSARWKAPGWVSTLARPLPPWARVAGVTAVLLLLGTIFLSGDDWGDGVARAGITAGVLALVVAALAGVRFFAALAIDAREVRARQFAGAGLLVVLLFVTCASGIGAAAPLHRAEAGVYEAQRGWQHAIAEYTRAGETGSNAADIARVYVEWGEQLNASGAYGEAIDKFQLVLTNYSAVPQADARAQTDVVAAYLAWGKQALQQQDYPSAMQRLDTLLALAYCAADCQSQGSALDATAYYGAAEANLASGDYQGAVDAFHVLLARFVAAPEAAQAHGDVAKALLGLGQQQLAAGPCASAVTTYQELAGKYGDTPQGQQAVTALAQPQAVTGRFTKGIPAGAFVILAHNLSYNMSNSQYLAAVAPPAPRTTVHGDGSFRFASIRQGTWDLVWAVTSGGSESYLFTSHQADGTPVWVATVGPLCPFDFGSIDETFPTP